MATAFTGSPKSGSSCALHLTLHACSRRPLGYSFVLCCPRDLSRVAREHPYVLQDSQDRLPGTHIQTCTKDQIFIAGSCDDGEVCSRLCSRYPEHQKSCARTHPREHSSSHTVRGWDLATVRDFVQAVDGEGRHGACH